jgi:Ni/Fe-hydrogenase b-type cytochrome subunit
MPMPATTPPPGRRHHAVVRATHWINVGALTVMVASGLRIFNAYPRFAPRGGSFCCYPLAGRPVPEWLTFGGWLAGARNWHFAMMWVLAVNGLVYLGWVYLHGEWRDLVPRRGDARDVWQMIRFYATLRPDHPPQGKHNALQKLSYFAVPLIGAAAVVSGLAIWKPVSLGWLTRLLGGYVWARYWHFLAMVALVGFTIVHVFMVLAVDPHSMRSMITGRYDEARSPRARNARPFPGRRPRPAPGPVPAPSAETPTAEESRGGGADPEGGPARGTARAQQSAPGEQPSPARLPGPAKESDPATEPAAHDQTTGERSS